MIRREPIRKMKDWILCDTCKLAMKAINRRARAMRDRMKGKVFHSPYCYTMYIENKALNNKIGNILIIFIVNR